MPSAENVSIEDDGVGGVVSLARESSGDATSFHQDPLHRVLVEDLDAQLEGELLEGHHEPAHSSLHPVDSFGLDVRDEVEGRRRLEG